jgi:hypothetical protein
VGGIAAYEFTGVIREPKAAQEQEQQEQHWQQPAAMGWEQEQQPAAMGWELGQQPAAMGWELEQQQVEQPGDITA